MVAVADRDKKFERAGKGTIIRGMTAKKFAAEIDALYTNTSIRGNGPFLASPDSLDSIETFVLACVEASFPLPDLAKDRDLYVLGLDSLKTIEITTLLKAGMRDKDSTWLSPQSIYANPTVQKLSGYIYNGALAT